MNYPLYTPWKQVHVENKTPIPRNCEWCGGQLYLEDRTYHKGLYYHSKCFHEMVLAKSAKYRNNRKRRK